MKERTYTDEELAAIIGEPITAPANPLSVFDPEPERGLTDQELAAIIQRRRTDG
jgi:hypothetical protein